MDGLSVDERTEFFEMALEWLHDPEMAGGVGRPLSLIYAGAMTLSAELKKQLGLELKEHAGIKDRGVDYSLMTPLLSCALQETDDIDRHLKRLSDCAHLGSVFEQKELATTYVNANRFKDALEPVRRAVDLAPAVPDNWHKLAMLYHGISDLENAEECINQALKHSYRSSNSEKGRCLVSAGLIAKARGKSSEALTKFLEAEQLGEKGAEREIAQLYKEEEDWQGGIDYYSEKVRSTPDDIHLWINLAYFCSQAEKYELAINQLELVLKKEPNNLDALYSLANVYWRKGDLSETVSIFKRIIGIAPDFTPPEGQSPILLQLGMAYYEVGQYAKAIEVLNRVVVLPGLEQSHLEEAYAMLAFANVKLKKAKEALDFINKGCADSRSQACFDAAFAVIMGLTKAGLKKEVQALLEQSDEKWAMSSRISDCFKKACDERCAAKCPPKRR